MFPGSKFVFTTRDTVAWHESCRRHHLKRENETSPFVRELGQKVFGAETYDPAVFAAAYERHDTNVRKYFAARAADLLCEQCDAGTGLCRRID